MKVVNPVTTYCFNCTSGALDSLVFTSHRHNVPAAQLCLNILHGYFVGQFDYKHKMLFDDGAHIPILGHMFPGYSYRILHHTLSNLFHTFVRMVAHFLLSFLQSCYLDLICKIHRNLLLSAVLISCIPNVETCTQAYHAFMNAIRNNMSRHDFLACVASFYHKNLTLCHKFQHCLSNIKNQTAQIAVLYQLCSCMSPHLLLPWLFIAIQIISIFGCYRLFRVPSFPQASGAVSPFSQVQNIEMQFPHEKRSYPYGGSKQQEFSFQDIEQYIVAGNDFDHTTTAVRFIDHVDSTGQIAYPLEKNFVHANIPLEHILPYLSVRMALKVARLHHIRLGSHVPKSDFSRHFEGHACASCNLYLSIFSVIDSKATRRQKHEGKRHDTVKINLNKSLDEFIEPSLQDMKQGNNFSHTENFEEKSPLVDPFLQPAEFPPAPLSEELSREIISNFCANSSAAALEEAGCAVCGQLVPVSQLSKLKAVKNLLHILHASGITRVEWSTASQSVREFSGPVLDYHCNHICDNCRQCL